MKANELMIGDWVCLEDENLPIKERYFNIEYLAISAGVSWVNQGTNAPIGLGDGESLIPVFIDEISPIPLTPEILEKNGFIKGDTMDLGDEIYCVKLFNIHYDNEERQFWVCNFFESEYGTMEINDIFQIKYVHELQHALRLYKVEKEIVL